MQVRDYNGAGRWSADSVLERYRSYAQQIGALLDENIAPRKHTERSVTQHFPFGRILKSNTARALRRAQLGKTPMSWGITITFDTTATGHLNLQERPINSSTLHERRQPEPQTAWRPPASPV